MFRQQRAIGQRSDIRSAPLEWTKQHVMDLGLHAHKRSGRSVRLKSRTKCDTRPSYFCLRQKQHKLQPRNKKKPARLTAVDRASYVLSETRVAFKRKRSFLPAARNSAIPLVTRSSAYSCANGLFQALSQGRDEEPDLMANDLRMSLEDGSRIPCRDTR